MSSVPLSALGISAQEALRASRGIVTVFAPLTQSIYGRAGDEVVWLGPSASTLHPRAMLALVPLDPARWREGDALVVDASDAEVWRPPPVKASMASRLTLLGNARAVVGARHRLPSPDGFG